MFTVQKPLSVGKLLIGVYLIEVDEFCNSLAMEYRYGLGLLSGIINSNDRSNLSPQIELKT